MKKYLILLLICFSISGCSIKHIDSEKNLNIETNIKKDDISIVEQQLLNQFSDTLGNFATAKITKSASNSYTIVITPLIDTPLFNLATLLSKNSFINQEWNSIKDQLIKLSNSFDIEQTKVDNTIIIMHPNKTDIILEIENGKVTKDNYNS
ncbi:hypothetical protein [Mycoplasma sp. P36-A1]|uniref:hypothetical protein n=1 Tax=Mycoplasma sp. P36-A1 TaxID=3252900 RepID=UPI003C2E03EC